MWKVKRMNPARIAVLAVAIVAGGIAAYLASGSDDKPAPVQQVAQLQTVDVLVAKNEIGLGQSVKPDDLQWQTWPAATASGTFIKRTDRPEATKEITGSIARKYCGGGHGGYALYLFNNPSSRDAAIATTPELRAVEPFCRV